MLSIDHLRKNYGSFRLDCTLSVKPGYITGLVGQNGSGKSTTFKAVLGLIRPDGGTVTLFGKDSCDLTVKDREKLGVVLSDSGFSGYLTVRDILPVLGSMYRQFDRHAFVAGCSRFQIPLDKKIRDFSTGMKAKLKFLTALNHKAQFLILDEPTAGLDVLARDELLDMLRAYIEEDDSRSVLISSHISADLETLCDDFYMIHDGHILLHEETDVLLSDYGILKLSRNQYEKLDRRYLLRVKEENFGYSCLTCEKQFYAENYPDIVIEKGSIDDMIAMMIKGSPENAGAGVQDRDVIQFLNRK